MFWGEDELTRPSVSHELCVLVHICSVCHAGHMKDGATVMIVSQLRFPEWALLLVPQSAVAPFCWSSKTENIKQENSALEAKGHSVYTQRAQYGKNLRKAAAQQRDWHYKKVHLNPAKVHLASRSIFIDRLKVNKGTWSGSNVPPTLLPSRSQTKTNCGASYQCTPTSNQLLKINVNYSYSLHEKSIKVTGCWRWLPSLLEIKWSN